MKSTESHSEWLNEDLDPIGMTIRLSEMRPIMNASQAEQEEEISSTIRNLSILKLVAASKGDKNRFNLISKQQIQVAKLAERLIMQIENDAL